jgi:hypothetical protein
MRFTRVRIALFTLILIVSFQNCEGPQTMTTDKASTDTKKRGSTTGASTVEGDSGGLSVGSARNATRAPSSSSGSSISSGGSSTVGGGGSGSTGSGGTCLGCSTGGSSGGSSGGVIGAPGNYSFEITEQPKSKTITEGAEFTVGVSVRGGKSPYKFMWYRNGQALAPLYGNDHYETYTSTLDRIYKEGDYHVVVTDADGMSKTSSKASIRMIAKVCNAGDYWFPVSTQSSYPDVFNWFGDLFIYEKTKYFVSQYNPVISQMQGRYSRTLNYLGFSYFRLGGNVSNGQEFGIGCGTDVPTVHSVVCTKNTTSKCNYWQTQDETITRYYEGSVDFKCRNGYLEYIRNTCKVITPPPPPPDTSSGG